MIFDTHAHLNFKNYDKDRDELIKNTLKEGVGMINVGADLKSSKKALEIAKNYDNVYAAVGIHPSHAKDEINIDKLRELGEEKNVVAIGEIGLDYYRNPTEEEKKNQKLVLEKQIELAKSLDLPLILHCRKAHSDMLSLLENKSIKGVVHCFSGDWETAQKYLDLGLYLGFNGIIYKNPFSKNVLKEISLSKALVETDCPFLNPPEVEGRNEPINTRYIIKEIANIKNINEEEVGKQTTKNAKQLFNL